MYYATVNKEETVTFTKNGAEHTVSWGSIESAIKQTRTDIIKNSHPSCQEVRGEFESSTAKTKDVIRRAKIYFKKNEQMNLEILSKTYNF
jgi:hypothetical protein